MNHSLLDTTAQNNSQTAATTATTSQLETLYKTTATAKTWRVKSIEPIRTKFKSKVLKLIASPFHKQRGLFIRVDEFMAAFDYGCITDNEARLYWNANIFAGSAK